MKENTTEMTVGTAAAGTADYFRWVKSTGGGNFDSQLMPFSYFHASMMTPGGHVFNGTISPTVSSGALTLALKTLSGGDPSATDAVVTNMGGVMRVITTPLSVTIAAAANTFNAGSDELKTKEIDLFAYLSWRAAGGSAVLGCSRIPYANLYSDFNGTATNEKYAAFSTAPAATDAVYNIGRFAGTLSAGTAYTWTVPTFTASNLVHRPIYETRWLDYTPGQTAIGGGTLGSSAVVVAKYQVAGMNVNIYVDVTGTITGTVTNIVISQPVGCPTGANGMPLTAQYTDNTSTTMRVGTGAIVASGATIRVRAFDSANWVAGSGAEIRVMGLYPIV